MTRRAAHPLAVRPGLRVLIVGPHPWAGHTGEYVRTDTLHVLNQPGLLIKLDNGIECYVLDARLLRACT